MGRRVAGFVILLAVLIGGYLLWKRHSANQELASGDVHCVGCMTPAEHARFVKENAGETADGISEHKSKTAQEETATDFQDTKPSPEDNRAVASPVGLPETSPTGLNGIQASMTQPPASATPSSNSANSTVSDTLPLNPQNGTRFSGSGPYQWYRQGNITWRINTATGRSCIVYATMEEWRKSIVLSHGCGRNA